MKTDICIIGGGVIGLYSAYALHSRGLKVAVIDRGEFGMQCTAAAGGILSGSSNRIVPCNGWE